MAKDWGLKITKPGASTTTVDPRDMLFSSKYQMFKYHNVYTASVVFNPGDKTKTVSVAHGLGYVPAHLGYGVRSDDNAAFIIPSLPNGIDDFDFAECWADATNIYFKYTLSTFAYDVSGVGFNGWNQIQALFTDCYSNFGTNAGAYVGKDAGGGSYDCGYRFASVPIDKDQTISSASVDFYIAGKQGSSDIALKTWGIDEDNVGSFGSDLGKTKTTAETAQTIGAPSGSYFGINTTDIVREIIARSGWSNGNAMGFYTFDNGTASDNWIADLVGYPPDTFLKILLPGTLTVNFKVIVFKDRIV